MEQKNFSLLTARAVIPQKKSKKYSRILGGFPDSVFMKSGLVTLEPGEDVGLHSTGEREELLIILEGRGSFLVENGESIKMEAGGFLYCPPGTGHNVINDSNTDLRYIYVVSKTVYS